MKKGNQKHTLKFPFTFPEVSYDITYYRGFSLFSQLREALARVFSGLLVLFRFISPPALVTFELVSSVSIKFDKQGNL